MSRGEFYTFVVADAIKYGLDAAVVLEYTRQMHSYTEGGVREYPDATTWICGNRAVFAKIFPFITPERIEEIVRMLVGEGVV